MTSTGKKLKAELFDITIDGDLKNAGTYQVRVTPKNINYTGEAKTTLTVVSDKKKLLSRGKASVKPKNYPYTGDEIIPSEKAFKLTIGKKTLTYGTDYTVSCMNNIMPGKATVVFTAIPGNPGGYAGSITGTFVIKGNRQLTEGNGFTYEYNSKEPYQKGGARPFVTVRDGGTLLKNGRDYTLSYAGNKAAGTATVTVKGKGCYTGSVPLKFEVVKSDMSGLKVYADDKAVKNNDFRKPSVRVYDSNGKKLSSRDYSVGEPEIPKTLSEKAYVDITGKGQYAGEVRVYFRYYESKDSLEKAERIRKIPDQAYTGKPVTLAPGDLAGVLSFKGYPLVCGKDYEIQTYSKNISKGRAKVTLKGLEDYVGTKTLSFKITGKSGSFKGALVDGVWK